MWLGVALHEIKYTRVPEEGLNNNLKSCLSGELPNPTVKVHFLYTYSRGDENWLKPQDHIVIY